MDPFTLLILGFLWFLFSRLRKGLDQSGTQRPPPLPPGTTGDATQREGSKLEILLRQLERSLNEAAAEKPTMPIPTRPASQSRERAVLQQSLPAAEEVEERESLEEAEPEVVSLEREVRRPARARLDREERAAEIETARVAAAEARSGALTRADHMAFDQKIRSEPADATAVRTPTTEQLRQAVVWREILGPPASLREDVR